MRASCLVPILKQIGLGILQYAQDFDEKASALWTGTSFPGRWRWMDCVQPYAKSSQVFNCPSDSDRNNQYRYVVPDSVAVNLPGTTPPDTFGSYVANNAYWGNMADEWGGAMASNFGETNSIADIQSPTDTFMVGDGNGSFQLSWRVNNGPDSQPDMADISGNPAKVGAKHSTDTNLEGKIVERHLDTLNVVFCDGHVKAMKMTKLMEQSKTPPTWGSWASAADRAGLRYFTRAKD